MPENRLSRVEILALLGNIVIALREEEKKLWGTAPGTEGQEIDHAVALMHRLIDALGQMLPEPDAVGENVVLAVVETVRDRMESGPRAARDFFAVRLAPRLARVMRDVADLLEDMRTAVASEHD